MMSANMVDPCGTVADVGCDHAHTCIWLLQNGIAKNCIGMDVRKGPLKKAEENLALYGCSDKVELRLSFGLDELRPGEADTIVIAGMGGEMIRDILEKDKTAGGVLPNSRAEQDEELQGSLRDRRGTGKVCRNAAPVLVLQPQTHYECVRRWLSDNGFRITAEDMCREDDKFYPCIKAKKAECFDMDPAEIYFGPRLLAQKHPVLKEFLEIEYRKKRYMLEQISKSDTPEAEAKKAEVMELFDIICDALGRF